MNLILRRQKTKDDNQFSIQQGALQLKIEEILKELGNVEALITQSETTAADCKEQNVEQLDQKINEEKEKISVQVSKLNSESLTSKITTCKEALDELGKIKKKQDECSKKLN